MESMAIADVLQARFPEEILQRFSFQGQIGVGIRPDRVVEILGWLRDDQAIRMDHLRSLCGVDNTRRKNGGLGRFEVVYNLYSIALRHEIRIRAQLNAADPIIDSVVGLWPGADWMERETYDLMGIHFDGHPDLRRVLLPEDWEGHPLRKEYPLRGRGEWVGITDLREKIKELDAHGFKSDDPGPRADDSGTGKREGEC